jgi:8-oxo-dGTP pyrophosphatase MutT (NUDIX family)
MVRKNKERTQATSCGGVVWRESDGFVELLLIKQFSHQNRWGVPKGHTHEGEQLAECAVREVREETGVDVTLGLRLPDVHVSHAHEDKTVVSFLARPVGDDTPKHDDPDSEVADARWFGIHELPEILVYQRPLVAAAVQLIISKLADAGRPRMPMGPPEPVR